MLNLILGNFKTGKTKTLFDYVDSLENKNIVIFVPSQMRALEEENYIKMQNKEGIINMNITTISSFAKDFLISKNAYNVNKYITKLDRKLILSKLIFLDKIKFKMFAKVKNYEGFLDNLDIYMDIFKKEEITKDKISELDNKILKNKLNELMDVYDLYSDTIKDKFIDSIDEMEMFLSYFNEEIKNNNTAYFFDSYNNFSNYEMKFVKMIIDSNAPCYFTINTDILERLNDLDDIYSFKLKNFENYLFSNDNGIYDIPNKTLYSIVKEAFNFNIDIKYDLMHENYLKANNDVKFLAKNIFVNYDKKIDSSNVKISLLTNIYDEVDFVANNISKHIREDKFRYNDFCVLVPDIDTYNYVIKKVFYEHNIPVNIDKKIKLSDNILVKYIIKLFDIALYGFKKENIFEILKIGLNNLNKEDIDYLENYVLEFNLDSYKFLNEFFLNNEVNGTVYDLDKINTIRKDIINIFSDILDISKDKFKVKDIITKIYTHLENNSVLDNYLNMYNILKDSDDPSVKYMASTLNSLYNNLINVFDSIFRIYNDDEITLIEFYKIFKISIKDINVKSIDPTIDNVSVIDINSSKIYSKKICYILNFNEDIIPSRPSSDMLFDDNELLFLEENNDIKIKESSTSKINMQLYNLKEYFNCILDKLYISILASDKEGKTLRKSFVVKNILDLLNTKVMGNVTCKDIKYDLNDIYSNKEAIFRMINIFKLNNYVGNDNIFAIYDYLINNTEFKDILNYIRVEDDVKKVSKGKLVTSVSKLEQYKACPFSYFLKYVLKVDERKIYSISTIDIGNFMHKTLEEFSIYLVDNNLNWFDILSDIDKHIKVLYSIIDKIMKDNFLKHYDNIKYEVLKQKLKVTMKKVIITVARSFSQSKFVPLGYEIEFKEGTDYVPIEIGLDDGNKMSIIGKIDRADVFDDNGTKYLRIVDYKSSDKKLSIDNIKEGISLQLITYLISLIDNIKNNEGINVKPAAMLYFNLSERLVSLSKHLDDEEFIEKEITKELRMKGIFLKDVHIIECMDRNYDNDDRLIDMSVKTINSQRSSSKSKKLVDEDEFDSLIIEVKDILKNIGNEINLGNFKIKPNKKKDFCKYCKYGNICRKENLL